jgi:hypothetical protein
VLRGPTPPPPGTTILPSTTGAAGLPSVYYGSTLNLTTTGCPGGTATYEVTRGGTVIAGGSLSEGPAGTYAGTIPPLRPNTGYAIVTIRIDCPAPTPDSTVSFDIYIDPSGLVRDLAGNPIEGATVILYRAENAAGPFAPVPDGSFVMSPANRSNPTLTDAAGHFGWDVIAGYYKVRAQKDGCTAAGGAPFVESGVLIVPPEVTDLDLRLDCPPGSTPGDALAPTTTATPAPAANGNGWNDGPVSVQLTAIDEAGGSGVDVIVYALSGDTVGGDIVAGDHATVLVTAEGVTTISFFAVDRAGNAEAPQTLDVRIDATAPSISFDPPSPPPNLAGWHNGDVTFAFTGHDGISGVDSITPGSPLVIDGQGVGLSREVTIVDKAGNRATFASPAVAIDRTAPELICSATPSQLWPANHKLIPISVAVVLTDGLSGPAAWSLVSVASSEPDDGLGDGDTPVDVDGFEIGRPDGNGKLRAERSGKGTGRAYSLTYRGGDLAGNTSTCTVEVVVPHDK